MSLQTATWLFAFIWLVILGFSRRPAYAISAYLMTFYLSPNEWWWGSPLCSITTRWNLTASILVVLAVTFQKRNVVLHAQEKRFFFAVLIYVINAIVVHFTLASNELISFQQLDLIWKSSLLVFFISQSIRDHRDINIIITTTVISFAYIGFAVIFQDQGANIRGRLEGINLPGASGSNGIAAVASLGLIYSSYLVFAKPFKSSRIIGLLASPLILDLILRANSRGALLSLIIAGLTFQFYAGKKLRKMSLVLAILGLTAVIIQAQDEKIWSRFATAFADSENRESSAQSRLDYWKAGIAMAQDYPLGSGGRAAFISDRGLPYILQYDDRYRSVHNGYISILIGWGVQGFLLLIWIHFLGISTAIKMLRREATSPSSRFLFIFLLPTLVCQLSCSIFGDYLDGEWILVVTILILATARIELNMSCSGTAYQEPSDFYQKPEAA